MSSDVRTIASLTRLMNSHDGNPRWRVVFTDGTAADTKPDAAINYGIGNPETRGPCVVELERGQLVGLTPVAP